MKVNICGYEVEVKAKGYGSNRFNKQDTLAFLCALNVELSQAEDKERELGYTSWADVTGKSFDAIHTILEENNYIPTV